MTYPENISNTPAAREGNRSPQGAKHGLKLWDSVLGMGAEILFACGLALVGFLISLLSGW